MKSIIVLLFVLFVQNAFAEQVKIKVISAIKDVKYDLGVGSKVELTFIQKNEKKEAIFLGRMVNHPELGEEILFLDEKETRVVMIDAESMTPAFLKSRLQNIISPVDQAGETCAAYALFHYWIQTGTAGFQGNGQLSPLMSNERNRLKLLEESITSYYMGRSANIKPIMKKFGDRFGFKCKEKIFTDSKQAVDFVFAQTMIARPVIMEFYIGPDMVTSTYEIEDYETKVEMDPRLWLPRKVGQKNTGGHAIVAAAAFVAKGRKKVMVLDSDWSEPRIWDLDTYLGGKTAIDEMIFHTCE